MYDVRNKQNFSKELKEFLIKDYNNIKIEPLKNDLSKRKFYRLNDQSKTFIVMDSSKEKDQFHAYLKTTFFLEKNGFSVPKIIQIDIDNSIIVMEDFGDVTYNNYLSDKEFSREKEVYQKSICLISELQKLKIQTKGFPVFSPNDLAKGIDKFISNCVLDLYQDSLRKELYSLIFSLNKPSVYVLRDFHADNLLWLSKRKGVRKVGLIDFQDLSIGYQSYDLVSFLLDARRFVPEIFEEEMKQFYISLSSHINKKYFLREYDILALQRNLRIYGLFTECHLKYKRNNYLKYLPNVSEYIVRVLDKKIMSNKNSKIIIQSL